MPPSRKPRKVHGPTKIRGRSPAKRKMPATARVPLTPAEDRKLDQIAQAHTARMVAEFKDVRDIAQSFERGDPSLGGKGAAHVPGERDRGAKVIGGSRDSDNTQDDRRFLMPSTDLSSYATGAASGDATVTKDPSTGVVEKTWTTRNDDGTTTLRTSAHNPQDGSTTSTQTTRGHGNEASSTRVTDRRDGSSDGTTRITDRRGRTVTHEWARDSSGNLYVDQFRTTDRQGRVLNDWDRATDRRRGLVRLPSDDAGSELGRRLGARFSHGSKKPAPAVTQVNPGERDDSGPPAPKITLGKKIVVNPGIEAGTQAREAGTARRTHWQRQLRARVGGQVNPPGPSRGKS